MNLRSMLFSVALLAATGVTPAGAAHAPDVVNVLAPAALPLSDGRMSADIQNVALDAQQYYVYWWSLPAGAQVYHSIKVAGVASDLEVYVTGPDENVVVAPAKIDGEGTVTFTAAAPGQYNLWLDDRGRSAPQGLKLVTVSTVLR